MVSFSLPPRCWTIRWSRSELFVDLYLDRKVEIVFTKYKMRSGADRQEDQFLERLDRDGSDPV